MKIIILVSYLLFWFSKTSTAQKIEMKDYKNKAQAYAILSAQYSEDAYYYTRQNFFSNSMLLIKSNSDTASVYAQIAIEYADSALLIAHDSSTYAKTVMLVAIDYQQKAITCLEQIAQENKLNRLHDLVEESMYFTGNALTEAYESSLFFDWRDEQEENVEEKMEGKRYKTRLESDEFSFMTIKEIYGGRMIEIEDEIVLLQKSAETNGGDLEKINSVINQLRREEKELVHKMKNSEDKLIKVKNDLSQEMLSIVNKEFFTTDKEGFYNDSVPIPVGVKIPKGLVYRVQIGFFKSQLAQEHFDGIFPISSEKIDASYYRYTAGNFSKYEEAKNAKIQVLKKGYTDAFIVAYIDGVKVPISKALESEGKQ